MSIKTTARPGLLALIALTTSAFLFIAGWIGYAGSKPLYLLFSAVSLVTLLSGFYRRAGYGYMFFVAFLWLGFWFKLSANFLWLGYFPFGEPVGNFDSSAAAWDKVLWIAISAHLGVVLGRIAYGLIPQPRQPAVTASAAPVWYPSIRIWLWAFTLLAIVGTAVLNIALGIHQIGMAPRTILPWPLNALIAWMLNLGSAVLLAVLIWWDVGAGKKVGLQFYALLGEAFISTVSIISRAGFPFHLIPPLVATAGNRNRFGPYTKMQIAFFAFCSGGLLLLSITAVSFTRDYRYTESAPAPITQKSAPGAAGTQPVIAAPSQPSISSFRPILIHQLLINRWIGLEGVMAVSAYADNSQALWWRMLAEKRQPGQVGIYQQISNSTYQSADPRFQFASLPGASAFFFSSGSMIFVTVGMAAMAFLMLLLERLISALVGNPMLCSLFGMAFANTASQFGVAPRQDLPFLGLIIFSTVLIWILQSEQFSLTVSRLRNLPAHQNNNRQF